MLAAGAAPPILVGTDFSDGAWTALRRARWLADRSSLRVKLVHVVERGGTADPAARAGWLDRAGLEVEAVEIRHGQAWLELARAAMSHDAAALVVGSHGRSGLQLVELGSTASRVSLVAPCPVIVIGPRAQEWPAGGTGRDTQLSHEIEQGVGDA
ncbi:MAG: universal stress protein [Gemmatimonadales bacterium]